ncbi:MAG: efflux RND transporter permease subunit, partial [Nitrospiraceae bacterium]
AVYLPIMKQAGANTIEVIDGIKDVIPKLKGLSKEVSVKLVSDQSLYIRQAIQTLEHEGLLGGGLACLMVLIFLASLRSTVIIALALPLSIMGGFVLMYFSGQSINVMTLGGLALVIGTLLDNNIVVLENVHRHLAMGKTPKQAAGDGTSEVALPMLIITISILIVYLPIMFFTGIVRFLFVPLALAVAFTMVVSYISSMTVAPVAMAALLKSSGHAGSEGHAESLGLVDRLFTRFVNRCVQILRWCLRHKILVIAGVVAIFVGSLLAATRLATEFFPKVDAGSFIMNVSVPEGTRLENTEAIVAQIEDLVRQHIPTDELEQIVSNVGLPQGWMVLYTPVNGPHQAFMIVNLKKG